LSRKCLPPALLVAFLSLSSFIYGFEIQTIDLSGYPFEKRGSAPLSGKWEFYWNELLCPVDFKSGKIPKPDKVDVKGSWHLYDKKYDVLGCATYRVRILLNEHQKNLSIYIPLINSSARIWVGEELVEELGFVNKDLAHYHPRYTSTLISLPEGKTSIDLVIQVANYSYFKSGIVQGARIGNSPNLFREANQKAGIQNFFVGTLIALFIYQLILFFLYGRGRPYLYLGLICLVVAVRGMITHGGSMLLPDMFPGVELELWAKLEFFLVYSGVALFPCIFSISSRIRHLAGLSESL
jgi:hypothetical protein